MSESSISPRDLHRIAGELYPQASLLQRCLLRYRPYICPFELILSQISPGARVLDVGCGHGALLGFAARLGLIGRGVGLDPNPEAVAVARRMAERSAAPLEFRVMEANEVPDAGEFDVVTMVDVVHHVDREHQRRFIEAAAGAVSTEGRFIYKDMCATPRWMAMANQVHDLVLARQWVSHVPAAQVERWFDDLGFECVERSFAARLWYGHELRVFRRIR